tara:strand:- start:137 stop:490 length:354 start_codon:yes stop_codon:yes gene_type:complete
VYGLRQYLPGSTTQAVVQNNPDVDPTYFNGELFQVLPKACKLAYTFLEDQNGDLWFNTSGHGFAFYDWDEFVAFPSKTGWLADRSSISPRTTNALCGWVQLGTAGSPATKANTGRIL